MWLRPTPRRLADDGNNLAGVTSQFEMTSDVESFGDLLQQADELRATIDSNVELPRVEKNLRQILDAGSKLWSRTVPISQDAVNVKAATLLAPKGYDIPRIAQKLEGISSAKTFEPLEPIRETDIRSFLKNERENALLAIIEKTTKETFAQAKARHWECLRDEWEREKQKILNALLGSGQERLDLIQETDVTMGDSAVSVTGHRSTMNSVELVYARHVYIYNDQLVHGGGGASLVSELSNAVAAIGDLHVQELWSVVRGMADIPLVLSGSVMAARTSPAVQLAFTGKAKCYLEDSYKKFVTTTVYGNLPHARLGGVPGMCQLLRSFLKVRLHHHYAPQLLEGDGADEQTVWPLIYYCLRCGDLQAALSVAKRVPQAVDDFLTYLQEYATSPDRRLSSNSSTKMKLSYRRHVKTSLDPYKRIVYCVIGCCDLQDNHPEVAETIDDFIWLRLSQIQGSAESPAGETLTLPQLQTLVLEEFGESHFKAQQSPFVYSQVLLLTAQFEAAVEFMSRFEHLQPHAVHIALALYDLKLLLLPASMQLPLLSRDQNDPVPARRLNLSKLIMMHTRKFEGTDPREALQYFYFLRNLKSPSGENLFTCCVSELVLETREFEMLLGKMEPDGTRKPGALDKFQDDTQKIIEAVARDTENKGMFEDAVKLYDLAQQHEKALSLFNKLLCQVVAEPASPSSSRDRLRTLAFSVAERYKQQSFDGSRATASTFYLLLDLLTFFDFYHNKEYDQALNIVQQLKLLPFSMDAVDQKVGSFRYFADELRRTLPDVLLATMNILFVQYKNLRSPSAGDTSLASRNASMLSFEDGGKNMTAANVRSQARALITFAGMIPYRLPGDTNARLVQLEALMN